MSVQPSTLSNEEFHTMVNASRSRRVLISRVMLVLCGLAFVLVVSPLAGLMYELVRLGSKWVFSSAFYLQTPRPADLFHLNRIGGVSNAIVGSIVLAIYSSVIAVPLGVLAGLYLAESRTKLANMIRVSAALLAGLPSILVGLFAFIVFIRKFGIPQSAIVGAIAIALLMLPVIAVTTEAAISEVPGTLREAALALGAGPAKVAVKVVLPVARPGIVSGIVLALSRAVGETAPVLFVIGGSSKVGWSPTSSISSLPFYIYGEITSQYAANRSEAWGIALLLVVTVFALSITSRLLATRKKR